MRVLRRMPLRTTLLTLAVAGAMAAPASASVSKVVGHVYVNDNTAGTNTIAAFDRHADGTLTPVPDSPFAAGGAGTGTGIGSQGSLQIAGHGRFLVAADAGSNQVSVLWINPGGGLALAAVVSSGGVEPVSIAVHRHLVYVANAGTGGTNFTGFRLSRAGSLQPIPGSTVSLPDGSQPGDVLFNSTATKLVGTLVATSQIASYAVGAGGLLTAAPGSPYPAQGPGPFGSEFRPTNPSQLFVSNAHGGANNGTVSAFTVSDNGTLTSIGGSPFADHQTAPCWVEISHDGKFLFAVNTAVPSISRYEIGANGALELLGSTPFKEPVGRAPLDARLSPDGSTLWVVGSGRDSVNGFAVHGGSLTELSSSPTALPAGAKPFGIVVN